MPKILKIKRRAVLKGIAGVTLPLPILGAMGKTVNNEIPKRFCALYVGNGMSLPYEKHGINEWSWFPRKFDQNKNFIFGKSTEPLLQHRSKLSFLGELEHANGTKNDPHVCSDMWLTGAPLHDPAPGSYNTVSVDQVIAEKTKHRCRIPSLVLSVDSGTGYTSRTSTISYDKSGRPIPAENNPRRIFEALFKGNDLNHKSKKANLKSRIKLVDAVNENAKALNKRLGYEDGQKMDQYLTSLNEFEDRLRASEKWLNVPIKKQDYSHLDLNVDTSSEPSKYFKTMFDLISLVFDADITRSVSFLLHREDGMGISDTFPIKLGLKSTHHNLSHYSDKKGMLEFAKYDLFLSKQLSHFLNQMDSTMENNGSLLDNTIVLYGSGASTTHKNTNLPTLIAGGSNMGLNHGQFIRSKSRMTNMYLSIMQSMGISVDQFGDSNGTLTGSIFST